MSSTTNFLVVCAGLCASLVNGQLCSHSEFVNAVTTSAGFGTPSYEQYNNLINRAGKGQITTKRELAMFLANIIHESAGLTAKEEWGPPKAGTYVSDVDRPGKRYHGRGYMQLTWGYNYKAASQALYGNLQLLDDPDQVKTNDVIAWDTAYWFWSTNVHNANGVKSGNFGTTIKKINSGECGQKNPIRARKRIQIYQNVLRAFGLFKGNVNCDNPCDCVIPTGSDGSPSTGGGSGGSSCSQTYTVRSGDSFWLIAKNNGMTIAQLQVLNPSISNPSVIYPGQSVCVRR